MDKPLEGYCPSHKKSCSEVAAAQSKKSSDLFFAYPSEPQTRVDAISEAIKGLRSRIPDLDVEDWRDLNVEGNIIFCEICRAIRQTKCVVADISGLNFNVLFEFGFAIGSGKPVWPLLEEDSDTLQTYSRFQTLTTIGHSKYNNSNSILGKLRRKQPWMRKPHFTPPAPLDSHPSRDALKVLYVKSPKDNEPSLKITQALSHLNIDVITDDPEEIGFQPLAWYLDSLSKSCAVVIHLGADPSKPGDLHVAKCALVAGIALATGRSLLMVGEGFTHKPIDYHDLLHLYKSSAQASDITTQFMNPIVTEINALKHRMRSDITSKRPELDNVLQKINLGESIAENELYKLEDYFVKTLQYTQGLKPGFKLFVGKKGSGKTALAHMIATGLQEDKRNLVCQIKPKAYELNQLLGVIKGQSHIINQGYLLESMWKYMICSEILCAVVERIKEKAPGSSLSAAEQKLIEYAEDDPDVFQLAFPSRLVKLLEEQIGMPMPKVNIPERSVSERLHASSLGALIQILLPYLLAQEGKFAIIVDGLVGEWDTVEDRQLLSDILLSLISSLRDLWRDWSKNLARNRENHGMVVGVFLRSDIFGALRERAREPDKLPYEQICWEDAKALLDVINKRIAASVLTSESDVINWDEILEPGFSPEELNSIIEKNLLYRPRDIIVYFQRSIFRALQKKSTCLSRKDFESAMREYSEYVLYALAAERQPFIPDMPDLLLGFSDRQSILTLNDVETTIREAGIAPTDVEKTVKFLIESSFLGLRVGESSYRFALTPSDTTFMQNQAGKYIHKQDGRRSFQIHKAFHNSLGITP